MNEFTRLHGSVIAVIGHGSSDFSSNGGLLDLKKVKQFTEAVFRNFRPARAMIFADTGFGSEAAAAARRLNVKYHPFMTWVAFAETLKTCDVVCLFWNEELHNPYIESTVKHAQKYNRPIVNLWEMWTG